MADPVWGVKVSEEIKKKAAEIIEKSGMDSKTWFEKILEKAELDLLKEGSKDYAKDLEELEIHTARINSIFANMINRATFEKENIQKTIEEIKTSKDQIILGLQQDLAIINNKLADYESIASKALQEKKEALEQTAKFQETNDNYKSLILEYKDKIDNLSGLLHEYRQFGEDNKVLKEEKIKLTQDLKEKDYQMNTLQNSITTLNDKLKNLENESVRKNAEIEEKHKADLDRQQRDHKTELERLAEKKDLEKDREIVNIQNQWQEKLIKATDEYNNKLLELYKELDRLRENVDAQGTKKTKK